MKALYKYWIILALCLIVIIMAVVKVKYGYSGQEETSNQKPVTRIEPTQTTTPEPTLIPGFEVINKIPYQGTGFTVDRYLNPNELVVKVKGIDKQLAEKMVFEWLTENKVATESYRLKFE